MKKFIQRKFVTPVMGQLKLGTDPKVLALSGAMGLGVGVFPILGVTTGLGLVFGFLFKLNHIVLQVVNYAVQGPQVLLIPIYMTYGDRLFGRTPISFIPSEMKKEFLLDPYAFWIKFSGSMGRAVVLWLITLPFILGLCYFALLPLFKVWSKRYASK